MPKATERRRPVGTDAAAIGDRTGDDPCPVIVVGVGVPSGGSNSLAQLFANMPSGHGVAFVLIQHPAPSHDHLTVEQVKAETGWGAVEAADGMPVWPDRIHVVPPNRFLNINDCRLTLQEPAQCKGLLLPLDHFFCSLAADQRRRGCGIVLSGAGIDGAVGLSEIKAAGGRTLVERPGSDAVPEMAQYPAKAGVIDAVLPAGAMAEAIAAMAEQVADEGRNEPVESPEFDAHLRAILDILRSRVRHDFRCYKPNTLVRRIRRRMTLARTATFSEYGRFLEEHPEEVALLHKDLLIGVTEFFRQPQAWEALEEKVVSTLVENARSGEEIRIWVPGCSTGKEAYSLAMLLSEQVEKSGKKVSVQIFATDPDAASLGIARSGVYSKEEVGANISAARMKRFLARKDGRYQVVKEIRDQIVFAQQNITADPPFSKLDLVSCRNLLIYLDQEVQKKIVALFHFALRDGGFLFLGSAETIGDRDDLFEPVSKKWRIYRRIGVGRSVGMEIPVSPAGPPLSPDNRVGTAGRVSPKLSLTSAAQQMLVDRFAPACVMIDRKLQVLYVHGPIEDYLTIPAGELTTRVVDMAREGLRARLRGAIDKCLEINRPVSVTARVRRGAKSAPVKATVSMLRYPRETDGLLLITFEDHRIPAAKVSPKGAARGEVYHLEDELKVTREELQSTIEQLEYSNDQLKASNEEVTSTNEELQAANEEMETSKEELQSLNEELNTINLRLQEKVDELETTNNDVVNLLSSTSIATVFLDKDLKVRRYTPAITRLLSLIPSDVGRPVADILRRFTDETLLEDAVRVLADLTPLSKEVQSQDARWYIRRITPYRTQDDRIEGVVVTFGEVTELKQSEQRSRLLSDLLEHSEQPFGVGYPDGSLGLTNGAFQRLTGYSRGELQSIDWAETLTPAEWRETERIRLEEIQRTGQPVRYEKEYIRKDGTRVPIELLVHLVVDSQGRPLHYYSFITDLTERKKTEKALRSSEARLRLFTDTVPIGVIRWTMDGKVLEANDRFLRMIGYTRKELIEGRIHWDEMTPPEFCRRDQEAFSELKANGTNIPYEKAYLRKDGSRVPVLFSSIMIDPEYSWEGLAFVLDLTERKRAEEAVRNVALFPEENPFPILRVAGDGTLSYANRSSAELLQEWKCGVGNPVPDGIRQIVLRALESGAPREFEIRCGEQDLSFVAVPIVECGYLNLYGRLITERKRAEEALRRSRDELEQRVQERTTELAKTNEMLRHLSSRLLSAQEDERKRLAGDIHDTIGASLSAIRFKVEDVMRQIVQTPEACIESLKSISPLVEECVAESRRIQMDLRPSMLDDLGILATLSWLFRTFQTIYSSIRIEQELAVEEHEVPGALKIVIYRVMQEALNNIAKHSKADLARVSLRKVNGRLEVAIRDNGRGFDRGSAQLSEGVRHGLGLSSMRERIELSGGSFTLDSSEGKGTTLRASWPLP